MIWPIWWLVKMIHMATIAWMGHRMKTFKWLGLILPSLVVLVANMVLAAIHWPIRSLHSYWEMISCVWIVQMTDMTTTMEMSYVTKTIKWSGDILLTCMAITMQIIYNKAYYGQNSQHNLSISERPKNGLNQILKKYWSDTKETSRFFTKRYKQFLW